MSFQNVYLRLFMGFEVHKISSILAPYSYRCLFAETDRAVSWLAQWREKWTIKSAEKSSALDLYAPVGRISRLIKYSASGNLYCLQNYFLLCYSSYLQTLALRISQVVPNREATSPARVKPEVVTVVPIVTVDQPEIIEWTVWNKIA